MSDHRTCLVVLLAMLVCVGCGPHQPERSIVFGKVTYDGKIIGDGQISFTPKEGTKAPRGGSRIINGEYRVENKGGLLTGEYTVRIEGYELAEGASPPPAIISIDTPRGKQYLPEKYDSRSKLEITVSGEVGEFEKNFDLEK